MAGTPYRQLARLVLRSWCPLRAGSAQRRALLAAALFCSLWACEQEYSLPPTFCDDWCHATLRRDCADGPSTCVRECEITKASGSCAKKQRTLLGCYERADDAAFVCVDTGDFGQEERVDPEVCQDERDALFECLAPGFGVCLDLCRSEQARQLDQVLTTSAGKLDFSVLTEDAGVRAGCPVLDQPCENFCWTVFAFTSGGLEAQGVTPETRDGGATLGASCLETVVLGCFLPAPPGAPADAGPDADEPSMASGLDDCGGLFESN